MRIVCVPMSLRCLRVLAPIAVAGLVALVLVVVSAASPAGAIGRGRADRALLTHCAKVVLGVGRGSATPVSGSASQQVVSHLAVFRRTRSTADRLPAAARLAHTLAGAGATSYDPSAAVRLSRNGAHGALYAVPATLALPTVPAGCNGLSQFAGVGAYLALQAQETGSGPGACLISTQVEQSGPSGSFLPGAKPPKPIRTLRVALAVCKSEAVLEGYVGALGDTVPATGTRLALIPDGVSAITYTLADGRGFTVPVAGNLARPPEALSIHTTSQHPTAAELGRQLAADLPTTVTESGTSTSATTTLTRPVSLIADYVGSLSFLRGLLTLSSGASAPRAAPPGRARRAVPATTVAWP